MLLYSLNFFFLLNTHTHTHTHTHESLLRVSPFEGELRNFVVVLAAGRQSVFPGARFEANLQIVGRGEGRLHQPTGNVRARNRRGFGSVFLPQKFGHFLTLLFFPPLFFLSLFFAVAKLLSFISFSRCDFKI